MSPKKSGLPKREAWFLVAIFLIALAGLTYELIAATLASYLIGDSVRQFSFVIGFFLFAMGIGASLSRFVQNDKSGFVVVQIALALIGGAMAPILYSSFSLLDGMSGLLYFFLISIGVLVGMEIPLVARLLKDTALSEFRFENVLSFDYVGALVASLLFPIVILPNLGLLKAGIATGILNLSVGMISAWILRDYISKVIWLFVGSVTVFLIGLLVYSERLVQFSDTMLYESEIIYSQNSSYQKITLTTWNSVTQLYLNNSIQFDTRDEFRYHEALVHPAMLIAPTRENILILGGGDGMAAREVLRYSDVHSLVVVDLDPHVTDIFKNNQNLAKLNDFSLSDPRVRVQNQDAWKYLEDVNLQFDVVILDLPDPKDVAVSKLYTSEFYTRLTRVLTSEGVIVTQAGSPIFARSAFWSINKSMRLGLEKKAEYELVPYHVNVPSFGEWGFILASANSVNMNSKNPPDGLQFFRTDQWSAMKKFSKDIEPVEVEANTLLTHRLVGYYNEGWEKWFQ